MNDEQIPRVQRRVRAEFQDDNINVHEDTIYRAVQIINRVWGTAPVKEAFAEYHVQTRSATIAALDHEYQKDMEREDIGSAQGDNEELVAVEDSDIPYFHDEAGDYLPASQDDILNVVSVLADRSVIRDDGHER